MPGRICASDFPVVERSYLHFLFAATVGQSPSLLSSSSPAHGDAGFSHSFSSDNTNNEGDCLMKRSFAALTVMFMAGASASLLAQEGGSQAEAQRAAQAARAAQLELESHTPKLAVTEEVLPLRIPGHTIGETEGVS